MENKSKFYVAAQGSSNCGSYATERGARVEAILLSVMNHGYAVVVDDSGDKIRTIFYHCGEESELSLAPVIRGFCR